MIVESLKARVAILSLFVFLAGVYLTPNFISIEKWPWWPAKNKLIYGLDIQGGLHLSLSADVDELIQERLSRTGAEIQRRLKKQENLETLSSSLSSEKPFFLFLRFKKPSEAQKAQSWIKKSDFAQALQVLSLNESQLKLAYYETRIQEIQEQALKQSIEVIRNRIDEFGVSEPLISSQGTNRILVQLPGIKDSQKAKDLIQRAAKLEMAIVNEEFPPEKLLPLITEVEQKGGYSLEEGGTYREYFKKINKDLKEKLPENSRLFFEKAPGAAHLRAGKIPYLVDMNQSIGGDLLEDAFVAFDSEFNRPIVSFRFQPEGRKRFSDMTAKAVKKQMAVILDNVVKSAPVIQERLPGGGQITLGSGNYEKMLEEANMIATTLKTGALPAHLQQLEEKTVGPTLGKDSINKGKKAGLIGLFLVMLFMLVYYRSLGVIANISLTANMFFLLALMSSLSAVLTLPGVAGIILTIGMAVDANVIIFERIKEELKKGASLKLAIKDGFGHAFSAILDANITTAIVCFVLMYFGSGPIRGFAVTLFCGILSSLFTAVFLSRTMMDILVLRMGWKKI